MAELKLVTPMLSNMEVVERISKHSGTSVYIVRSTKTQNQYILKHISVPESQKQIDALIFSGAASDTEDAKKYYEQVAADYKDELELLEMLSSSQNIACYRSYQIEPKEDGIGYDVYLLSEFRKTLQDVMNENKMSYLAAVNLGLDLCSALSDLRASELMHRDVKPSNIYLNEQEHFVLGDLGLAKIKDLKYCSIPEHMISSYSAPELFDLIGSIGSTTDIYAVGLILYRIFNGNHGPFEDERTSARAADKLRVTGQELPAPMYADYEMAQILLKACAFKPEDRYQTPEELKQELVEYVKRNQIEDAPIIPPIVVDEERITDFEQEDEIEPVQFADTEEMTDDFKQSFSPDTEMLNSIIESVHKELDAEEKKAEETQETEEVSDAEQTPRRKKGKKKLVPILLGVLGALIIAACVYFFVIEPATVFVDEITLVSKDSTSITVSVKSGEKSGTFDVVCYDAYGNSFSESYVKGDYNRFTDLVPGTAYTIGVKSETAKTVLGNSSLHETTLSETNVLSFNVNSSALTQVDITFTVNGPEPENWTVAYGYEGGTMLETTFEGHAVTIGNLEADKEYVFTLKDPEGVSLQGTHAAKYSTIPMVDIEKTSVALSTSKAIISWTIVGTAPEYWTVKYEGEDGSSGEIKVTDTTATLDGLTSGLEYHVTISAPTMLRSGALTIVPTATSVSDLKAEKLDDGNYKISWTCKDSDRDNDWTLHVRPKGANKESGFTAQVSKETSYVVDVQDLLPNTTYKLSLELITGEILEGDTSSEFTTPATKTFAENGLTGAYIGLYAMPTAKDWTAANLNQPKSKYASGEKIAFAIEGLGDISSSVKDDVKICIAIRNEQGLIVDSVLYTKPWNEMWENKLFVGSFPRVPEQSGKYTIEIFFNAKQVVAQPFTVE